MVNSFCLLYNGLLALSFVIFVGEKVSVQGSFGHYHKNMLFSVRLFILYEAVATVFQQGLMLLSVETKSLFDVLKITNILYLFNLVIY